MCELQENVEMLPITLGGGDVEITLPRGDALAAERTEIDSWADTLLIAALIVVLGVLVVLLGG